MFFFLKFGNLYDVYINKTIFGTSDMQISAITGISYINAAMAIQTVSAPLKRKLAKLGINAEEVKSDEEAQAIIAEKEQTKKADEVNEAQSVQNVSEELDYYDKELMSEIKLLASDLGMYVSEDIDMEDLLYNISVKISMIQSLFENNDNLKKVADQFNDRYQDLYARYMSKKNFLSTQIVV